MAATDPLSPRSVNSTSPVFEAGYAAFMADVFAKDVKSVTREDTPEYRALVLAGCRRLRLDKATGLLHSEQLAPVSDAKGEQWVALNSFPFSAFWLGASQVTRAVTNAWQWRLERFIPSAKTCYPTELPKKYLNLYGSAESMWNVMLERAASRRLGTRANKLTIVKLTVGGLWNFLVDRETLRLCHAYFGRRASLADYNFTVRRHAELTAFSAETPNLTRIIGAYLSTDAHLSTGEHPLPQDVVASAKMSLFVSDEDVDKKLPPSTLRPGFRATTRTRGRLFPRNGITPAGWRYLVSSTRSANEQLWQMLLPESSYTTEENLWAGRRLAPLVNLLARTGERFPLSFVKWVVHSVPTLGAADDNEEILDKCRDSVIRFIRLAGQRALAAKKKGALKRFISGELLLAWDWFRHQNEAPREGVFFSNVVPAQVVLLQKNATWASIFRAQHEWHAQRAAREQARREADQKAYREYLARQDAKTWDSALTAGEVKGVWAEPLTTGRALREEGNRMNHCVGGYVDTCQGGKSRIFSLKKGTEEGTLELVKSPQKTWKVRQVFGPSNTAVSKELAAAAKALAKAYGQADALQAVGKANLGYSAE